MPLYKIQGKAEKRQGIFYEFDPQEEPLGVGGMGKVYKGYCVDEQTGNTRQVAIKFMYDDLPAQVIERARREASIQLRHENLVEMLGFIETEEKNVLGETVPHYHVVSELLEGVMLDDLLQGKVTDRNGHLVPYAQKLYNDYQRDVYHFSITLVRCILSGLMTLHDAGYIHRDIDPTNIMITTDGHIKLIDFGIAKQMRSLTSHDKSLTVAGVFLGKPEYAAPELVLGEISEQDQSTDTYAVGILMFQFVVGHVPFDGDRHEILNKQLHEKVPLHLIKNKYIRQIIKKATEKSRSKRFQSAAEFRVALDQLPMHLRDSLFVWKKAYSIAAISLIVIAGIGTLFALQNMSSPPVPQPPLIEEIKEQTDPLPEFEPTPVDYKALYEEAVATHQAARNSGGDELSCLQDAARLYEESKLAAQEAGDSDFVETVDEKLNKVNKSIQKLSTRK